MNIEKLKQEVESLEAEIQAANLKRDELTAKARELTAERDKKAALITAAEKLAALSDEEKAALMQIVNAGSLTPGE